MDELYQVENKLTRGRHFHERTVFCSEEPCPFRRCQGCGEHTVKGESGHDRPHCPHRKHKDFVAYFCRSCTFREPYYVHKCLILHMLRICFFACHECILPPYPKVCNQDTTAAASCVDKSNLHGKACKDSAFCCARRFYEPLCRSAASSLHAELAHPHPFSYFGMQVGRKRLKELQTDKESLLRMARQF